MSGSGGRDTDEAVTLPARPAFAPPTEPIALGPVVLVPLAVRHQVWAVTSIPLSVARMLVSLADAAEAVVAVLRAAEQTAQSTARVTQAFERPLVKLAGALDEVFIDQTVSSLTRLPSVIAQATAITSRAESVLSNVETPLKALTPLAQVLDAGRVGGLVDRLDATLPSLVRLPDTEREMRLLRETLDRVYRVVDDISGRVSALPGAGLILRRDAKGRSAGVVVEPVPET